MNTVILKYGFRTKVVSLDNILTITEELPILRFEYTNGNIVELDFCDKDITSCYEYKRRNNQICSVEEERINEFNSAAIKVEEAIKKLESGDRNVSDSSGIFDSIWKCIKFW